MDFTKYTIRQQGIITGDIPLCYAEEVEIRRILAKAKFGFDAEVIRFAETELRRRSIRTTENPDYSAKQEEFLKSGASFETLTKGELVNIYYKAQNFGDRELCEKIETVLTKRDNWRRVIDGYTPQQTALITGDADLGSAHERALKGLKKVAVSLGDMDVVEAVDAEYGKRGLNYPNEEYCQIYDIKHLVAGEQYGKLKDYELTYALYLYEKKGDRRVLKALGEEIKSRSYPARTQKYSKAQEAVMSGAVAMSILNVDALTDLRNTLLLDDSRDTASLIKEVEDEIARKEDARRQKIEAAKNEYTDKQRKVLDGSIPLYKENTSELKVILSKAERRGEEDKAAFIKKEIEARSEKLKEGQPYSDRQQMMINCIESLEVDVEKKRKRVPVPEPQEKTTQKGRNTSLRTKLKGRQDAEYKQCLKEQDRTQPYTRRQKQILRGEIPLDIVKESELAALMFKAEKLDDADLAAIAEGYLEEKQRGAANVNIDGSKVVNGEISYEAISIGDLRHLAKKAKAQGDIRLFELATTLIYDKQRDYEERSGKIRKTTYYVSPDQDSRNKYAPKDEEWAMEILESIRYPTLCSMMDLQDVRLYAETLEDPRYADVARFLINERKDRSTVYKARTKQEARELLDRNTMYPIPWPEND